MAFDLELCGREFNLKKDNLIKAIFNLWGRLWKHQEINIVYIHLFSFIKIFLARNFVLMGCLFGLSPDKYTEIFQDL